jgi:hypothetical protein
MKPAAIRLVAAAALCLSSAKVVTAQAPRTRDAARAYAELLLRQDRFFGRAKEVASLEALDAASHCDTVRFTPRVDTTQPLTRVLARPFTTLRCDFGEQRDIAFMIESVQEIYGDSVIVAVRYRAYHSPHGLLDQRRFYSLKYVRDRWAESFHKDMPARPDR